MSGPQTPNARPPAGAAGAKAQNKNPISIILPKWAMFCQQALDGTMPEESAKVVSLHTCYHQEILTYAPHRSGVYWELSRGQSSSKVSYRTDATSSINSPHSWIHASSRMVCLRSWQWRDMKNRNGSLSMISRRTALAHKLPMSPPHQFPAQTRLQQQPRLQQLRSSQLRPLPHPVLVLLPKPHLKLVRDLHLYRTWCDRHKVLLQVGRPFDLSYPNPMTACLSLRCRAP